MLILFSLALVPFFLTGVSAAVGRLQGRDRMQWGNLLRSYWYVFAVLVGETMPSTSKASSVAVRCRFLEYDKLIMTFPWMI